MSRMCPSDMANESSRSGKRSRRADSGTKTWWSGRTTCTWSRTRLSSGWTSFSCGTRLPEASRTQLGRSRTGPDWRGNSWRGFEACALQRTPRESPSCQRLRQPRWRNPRRWKKRPRPGPWDLQWRPTSSWCTHCSRNYASPLRDTNQYSQVQEQPYLIRKPQNCVIILIWIRRWPNRQLFFSSQVLSLSEPNHSLLNHKVTHGCWYLENYSTILSKSILMKVVDNVKRYGIKIAVCSNSNLCSLYISALSNRERHQRYNVCDNI